MISYTKVRNDFMERDDLSPTEKVILIHLYGRKRSDGRPWVARSEQLQTALSLGRDATDRALSSLKAKGWLTDNRKAVRGPDGRIRRGKSTVIESRRGDVVMMEAVSAGRTESWKPVYGKPGYGEPGTATSGNAAVTEPEFPQVAPNPGNPSTVNPDSNEESSNELSKSEVRDSAPNFSADDDEGAMAPDPDEVVETNFPSAKHDDVSWANDCEACKQAFRKIARGEMSGWEATDIHICHGQRTFTKPEPEPWARDVPASVATVASAAADTPVAPVPGPVVFSADETKRDDLGSCTCRCPMCEHQGPAHPGHNCPYSASQYGSRVKRREPDEPESSAYRRRMLDN